MRVPQVNERVKEAPAQALRAMFAGIGQLLSVTDKIRGKSAQAPATAETTAEAPETVGANGAAVTPEAAAPETVAPETVAPEAAVTETPAAEAAKPEAAEPKEAAPPAPDAAAEPETLAPDADEAPATTSTGGHVRVISPKKAAKAPTPAPAEAETAAPAEPAMPAAAAPAESPAAKPAAAPAEPSPVVELPIANYDSLTIASLRARLRNLSVAQLGQLIEYEKEHAARADVIAMFERRIAKVQSES
jgi:hypothetical protein